MRRTILDWNWVPSVSVGPFIFGKSLDSYSEAYGLQKLEPACASAYWDTFAISGHESRLIFEDHALAGILCADSLKFRGADLLGITIADLRTILGVETEIENEVGLGSAVYYHHLGVTFWVVDDIAESATCNPIITD